MRTRLDKYLNETDDAPKRTKKNNELYEEIKHSEISNLHIGSMPKWLVILKVRLKLIN